MENQVLYNCKYCSKSFNDSNKNSKFRCQDCFLIWRAKYQSQKTICTCGYEITKGRLSNHRKLSRFHKK